MNMTLYDLESRINEYIKEHNMDDAEKMRCDNWDLQWKIKKVITEVLSCKDLYDDYKLQLIKEKGQCLRLYRKQLSIYIDYKKTKYTVDRCFGSYDVYGLKSVELHSKDNFKDIQDFIEQDEKLDKEAKEKHGQEYEEMFEKVGVNFYKGGFTLEELLDFGNKFRKLSRAEKKEMYDTYNNGEELWYY